MLHMYNDIYGETDLQSCVFIIPLYWCIVINEVAKVIGHNLWSESCPEVGQVAWVTSYHTCTTHNNNIISVLPTKIQGTHDIVWVEPVTTSKLMDFPIPTSKGILYLRLVALTPYVCWGEQ